MKIKMAFEKEISVYMDHTVKFCVLRHKLYHVVHQKSGLFYIYLL